MAKRLEVILDDHELAEIRRIAHERHQSVAEWVRSALCQALAGDAGRPAAVKLEALRASVSYAFPTGPIEQLNAEIVRGDK
jgi:hypothetical protein